MKIKSRAVLIVSSFLHMVMWAVWFIVTIFKLPYAKNAIKKVGEVLGIPFLELSAVWLLVVLISMLGFFFSLYIFLIGLYGDKEFKSILRENSIGFIKMSSATFENIALNVIRKLGGVKDARVIIKIKNDEIHVAVHATFISDVNIPILCEEAQNRIVQSIEQCTGIKTPVVKIIVDGVQSAYRGRVE